MHCNGSVVEDYYMGPNDEPNPVSCHTNCNKTMAFCKPGYKGDPATACYPSLPQCQASEFVTSESCLDSYPTETANYRRAFRYCKLHDGHLPVIANDVDLTVMKQAIIEAFPGGYKGKEFAIAGICGGKSRPNISNRQNNKKFRPPTAASANVPACDADSELPECYYVEVDNQDQILIKLGACRKSRNVICEKDTEDDYEWTDWCAAASVTTETDDEGNEISYEVDDYDAMVEAECTVCKNFKRAQFRNNGGDENEVNTCDPDPFVACVPDDDTICNHEVRLLCPIVEPYCDDDLDLCTSAQTCVLDDSAYDCECDDENMDSIDTDTCLPISTCVMREDTSANLVKLNPAVSPATAWPPYELDFIKNCKFNYLSSADCGNGLVEFSISVMKSPTLTGIFIEVGGVNYRISENGIINVANSQDVEFLDLDDYKIGVSAIGVVTFATHDRNAICTFDFPSTVSCSITSAYTECATGVCIATNGPLNTINDDLVNLFFEENRRGSEKCRPDPVNGGWSDYEEVSCELCSATCGEGEQIVTYQRTCNNPTPSNNGRLCEGLALKNEPRICNAAVDCLRPVDGVWGQWTFERESLCSVTCGDGVKIVSKSRVCIGPTDGGMECQTDSDGNFDSKDAEEGCNDGACMVTCVMSDGRNLGEILLIPSTSPNFDLNAGNNIYFDNNCAFYLLKDICDVPDFSITAIVTDTVPRIVVHIQSTDLELSPGGTVQQIGQIGPDLPPGTYTLVTEPDGSTTLDYGTYTCVFFKPGNYFARCESPVESPCGVCNAGNLPSTSDEDVENFFNNNNQSPGSTSCSTTTTVQTTVEITTTSSTSSSTPGSSSPCNSEKQSYCDALYEAFDGNDCSLGAARAYQSCEETVCGADSSICSFLEELIASYDIDRQNRETMPCNVSNLKAAIQEAVESMTEKCDRLVCTRPNQVPMFSPPRNPRSCASPQDLSAGIITFGERCVCAEGTMVAPGGLGECVDEEECGCVYRGEYLEIGEYYVDSNCNREKYCREYNVLEPSDQSCVDNAYCEDGECVCADGFMGSGYEQCNPEEEEEDRYCTSYLDQDQGVRREECICKMGYDAVCGRCVERNECEMGNHNCGENTVCVNTEGSFICECISEDFSLVEGSDPVTCADNTKDCPSPSCQGGYCLEKPGRDNFLCHCCPGYVPADNGKRCDLQAGTTAPDKCCACIDPECYVPPVGQQRRGCYVDTVAGTQVEYINMWQAFETRCQNGLFFNKADYARASCPDSSIAQTQAPDATTRNFPSPTPPPIGPCEDTVICNNNDENPDDASGPVCVSGTQPKQYDNYCAYKIAACFSNGQNPVPEDQLTSFQLRECTTTTATTTTKAPTTPEEYDCDPWSDCTLPGTSSVACGPNAGVCQRTCHRRTASTTEDVVETQSCPITCTTEAPPDANEDPLCTNILANGCSDDDTNSGKVCGQINNGVKKTYANLCELKLDACNSLPSQNFIKESGPCPGDGLPDQIECGGDPVLRMVTYNMTLADGSECVSEQIPEYQCKDLHCAEGGEVDLCCKATEWKEFEVFSQIMLTCQDESNNSREITISQRPTPTKCECS